MRYIFTLLALSLFLGCSEQSIETYTTVDGSGKKIVYNKETKEVYEVNQTPATK